MMIRTKISVAICFLLLIASSAFAFQGYVESQSGASLQWGNGDATARVAVEPLSDVIDPIQSRSMAIRAAAITARRQLLEAIERIRIDADQTVGFHLAEDMDAAEKVRMLLQNSKLTLPAPNEADSESQGEVAVSVSLRGAMADAMLPETIQFLSGIPPRLESSSTAKTDSMEPLPIGIGAGGGYTGVVIDARNINLTPALCPVVYDSNGVGVYGTFMVSRSVAVNSGVAAYSTTDEWVVLRNRVGESPLVINAVSKATDTDPVISARDAMLARAVLGRKNIGNKARVVIVLDSKPFEDVPGLIRESEDSFDFGE